MPDPLDEETYTWPVKREDGSEYATVADVGGLTPTPGAQDKPPAPKRYSPEEFASKIRQKYPGAYDKVDDRKLAAAYVKKYPVYASRVSWGPPDQRLVGYQPSMAEKVGSIVKAIDDPLVKMGRAAGDVVGRVQTELDQTFGDASPSKALKLSQLEAGVRMVTPQEEGEGITTLGAAAIAPGAARIGKALGGLGTKAGTGFAKLTPNLSSAIGDETGLLLRRQDMEKKLAESHPFVKSFGTKDPAQAATGSRMAAEAEFGAGITELEARKTVRFSAPKKERELAQLRDKIYGTYNREPKHDPGLGKAALSLKEDIDAVIPSVRNKKVRSILRDLGKTGEMEDIQEEVFETVLEDAPDMLSKVERKVSKGMQTVGQRPKKGAGISDYSLQETRAELNRLWNSTKDYKQKVRLSKVKDLIDNAADERGLPLVDINAEAKAAYYDIIRNKKGAKMVAQQYPQVKAILKDAELTQEAMAALDDQGKHAIRGYHTKRLFDAMDKHPDKARKALQDSLGESDNGVFKALWGGEKSNPKALLDDYAAALEYRAAQEAKQGRRASDTRKVGFAAYNAATGRPITAVARVLELVKDNWAAITGSEQSRILASKALREFSDDAINKLNVNIKSRAMLADYEASRAASYKVPEPKIKTHEISYMDIEGSRGLENYADFPKLDDQQFATRMKEMDLKHAHKLLEDMKKPLPAEFGPRTREMVREQRLQDLETARAIMRKYRKEEPVFAKWHGYPEKRQSTMLFDENDPFWSRLRGQLGK